MIFTAGLRTNFTLAHKGAHRETRPDEMLVRLLEAHRERHAHLWSRDPDDVLVGCAYPEGEQGYNIARVAALGAGLDAPGLTLNRLCGSSLDAVALASAMVKTGRARQVLVGGVESMSRVPRRGANFSESALVKERCPTAFVTMGETAEAVAQRFPGISRTEQEDYAARSHELADRAFGQGFYERTVIGRDESIRYPVNRGKMAALPPAFGDGGVVTAATSSPMSDGAACGFVLDETRARELGVTSGLRIVDAQAGSVAPDVMGLGPVPAVRALLARHQLTPEEVVAVEMNEAFAVQVLACQRQLELPLDTLNSWGGALALGHPLGASGLRLVMTLEARLAQRGEAGAFGLVTLCIGGGQGLAVLCEYVRTV